MASLDKKIRKIINNPKDVSFKDLQYVLLQFDFTERQPSGGSSHYFYKKKEGGRIKTITIPRKKVLKEVYVKKVIDLLNLDEY